MNVRDKLSAASLVVAIGLVVTPGSAQIPDSLAWRGLPDDPTELPGLVAAGQRRAWDMFKVGCPSDGGWAGAAFDALLEAAETDIVVRQSLVAALGANLGLVAEGYADNEYCPSEVLRYEAWLAERLLREWQDGVLRPASERLTLFLDLLISLESSRNPATHALVRDIAKDSTVHEEFRSLAAGFMVDHHFGAPMSGRDPLGDPAARQGYLDAYQAVLFELATGPPLLEFEANVHDILRHWRGESFDREYERVLMAAGRIRL